MKIYRGFFLAGAVVGGGVLAVGSTPACVPDKGDTGAPGVPGPVGPSGGGVGADARAQRGLQISPFPIDTSGMSEDQIRKVAYGSYLVNAIATCNDCHQMVQPDGTSKPFGGGIAALDQGAIVYARNITSDPKTGLTLTEDQFVEVLRTGKDFDNPGQRLFEMPWLVYRWMTIDDIKAIYAYIKLAPPVVNETPPDNKGAAAALAPVPFTGKYTDGEEDRALPPGPDSDAGSPYGPPPDPDNIVRGFLINPLSDKGYEQLPADQQRQFGRGSYLVNAMGDCTQCHTNKQRDFDPASPTYLKINAPGFLSGGRVEEVPPGLNIALKTKRVMFADLTGQNNGLIGSYASFVERIQLGVHYNKDGSQRPLTWPMFFTALDFRNMLPEDLEAVYTYIANLPKRTGANDKAIQHPVAWCTSDGDCNTAAGETCNGPTNECVNAACGSDDDCGACQTCAGHCVAPATDSACLKTGRQ